jgi:hypothetical protein
MYLEGAFYGSVSHCVKSRISDGFGTGDLRIRRIGTAAAMRASLVMLEVILLSSHPSLSYVELLLNLFGAPGPLAITISSFGSHLGSHDAVNSYSKYHSKGWTNMKWNFVSLHHPRGP